MLSQYRFLRATEAGFGTLTIRLRREILSGGEPWNRLFLAGMGLGVTGRVLSWVVDGTPTWPMLVFLGVEAAGTRAISATTSPWRRSGR